MSASASDQKKREKPNKAEAVGRAGYFSAKQGAEGRAFSTLPHLPPTASETAEQSSAPIE